jgi:hypothetical protein
MFSKLICRWFKHNWEFLEFTKICSRCKISKELTIWERNTSFYHLSQRRPLPISDKKIIFYEFK